MPVSLRGLIQLLVVLSSMQDVPEITEPYDSDILAKQVGRQADVLEANLSLFESYFMHGWVHTKLSARKAAILENLTLVGAEKWYLSALQHLEELYRQQMPPTIDKHNTYACLISYIEQLEQNVIQSHYLQPASDDAHLLFAIRMFFDLQIHKAAVWQMRKAVEQHESDGGLLLFDFSLGAANMPDTLLPTKYGQEGLTKILRKDQYDRIVNLQDNMAIFRVLLQPSGGDNSRYTFDPTRFVHLFLSLGSPECRHTLRGDTEQAGLYRVQQTTMSIAANHDLQDVIRTALKETPFSGESKGEYLQQLRTVFVAIDGAIRSVNTDMTGKTAMLSSHMTDIENFIIRTSETRVEFRNLLRRLIDEISTDHLNALANIYYCAKTLFDALRQIPIDREEIQSKWELLIALSVRYCVPIMENGMDFDLLYKYIETVAASGYLERDASYFWREFRSEFRTLCRKLDYDIRLVEKEAGRLKGDKKYNGSTNSPIFNGLAGEV